MPRRNTLGLHDIAAILEERHFSDENEFKPPPSHRGSAARSPSSRNDSHSRGKARVDSWRTSNSGVSAVRSGSRTAFQRALDARARLIEAKKVKAQTIRDESLRYRIELRAKVAEEEAQRAMRSRSRLNDWETERRQRELAAQKLQKQREANEIIKRGEQMLIAHMNQKADLERLKSLKERLLDTQAKKLVPPVVPVKFSAFESAGETLAETIFRLEMMRKQQDESLAQKRSTIYERHLEKLERRQQAPAPIVSIALPKKKLSVVSEHAHQNRSLVQETRAEEVSRMEREIKLLEKYHETKEKK